VLFLFDGHNLLNAGPFRSHEDLVDRLAGFVALHGARGVVVFDGAGTDSTVGALDIRFAQPADHVLERLAAEHREDVEVVLVSTDGEIRRTVGQNVAKRTSKDFAQELLAAAPGAGGATSGSRIEDALDDETRERLERWRRSRS
jgi:predicted RNA-binding protein with PIN domain